MVDNETARKAKEDWISYLEKNKEYRCINDELADYIDNSIDIAQKPLLSENQKLREEIERLNKSIVPHQKWLCECYDCLKKEERRLFTLVVPAMEKRIAELEIQLTQLKTAKIQIDILTKSKFDLEDKLSRMSEVKNLKIAELEAKVFELESQISKKDNWDLLAKDIKINKLEAENKELKKLIYFSRIEVDDEHIELFNEVLEEVNFKLNSLRKSDSSASKKEVRQEDSSDRNRDIKCGYCGYKTRNGFERHKFGCKGKKVK